MKALLIKDWKLLKNQRQFFLVTLAIVGVFLFTVKNLAFVVSYATIMYTLFTISTISYDEYHNGMSFLFTLPVSKVEYVVEKYSFGILTGCGAAAAVFAAAAVVSGIKGGGVTAEELAISIMTAALIAMFFLSFTIPAQLKFGAEKGRMALMAVSMVCFVLIMGGAALLKRTDLQIENLLGRVEEAPIWLVACVIGAGCVVMLLVSAFISLQVMKRREF